MPITLSLTPPLTTDETAKAFAFLGTPGVSGGTGTPPTDYFPSDPGLAPFPSPENSQIVNTGGAISGKPYLKDNDGTVHTLKLVNGVVVWVKGNATWPPDPGGTINQLLVRRGEVFAQWNSTWKLWNSVSVYNTNLPAASTVPIGSPQPPTPDPTPSAIAPGSSGVIIKAGPTQTLKTLTDAIPTAVAGDTIQLDAGTYTDTPPAWGVPLLIDLGGATLNATGKTSSLARGKSLLCPNADSIIQNGTITGVAMDQGSGQLTSAIRPDAGCGYLTIKNMKLHGNQCGVGHGGFPIVIAISDSDISGNGLLPGTNAGSLTHNVYVAGNRLTLTNVVSTAPNEAHAIKSRALQLVVNGGTFASDVGSCFDLPDGTSIPFAITNATLNKSPTAVDHHLIGYAEESTTNGAAGGTIRGGTISALCQEPFIVGAGTITASGVSFTGNPVTGSGVTLVGFPTVASTSPPPPPPASTAAMTINIANAPGWTPRAAYAAGSRVVAGPGWADGKFVNGAALWLWALEGAAGTSGASFQLPGTWTPANAGGGFDGVAPAGWANATKVTDNGLVWVCLSPVDYVTFTDAMTDGGGVVTTYSSKRNIWPKQSGSVVQAAAPANIQVWYGGVARQTYHAGQNGEADPIPMQDHVDFEGDTQPTCLISGNTYGNNCGMAYFWRVSAAAGDGHVEHRAVGWQLDRTSVVDATLGVTFVSDSPGNDNPGTGAPIGFSDSLGTFENIQLHSANWLCCAAHGFYLPGHGHTNNLTLDKCLLQSDAGPGVVAADGGTILTNSLIVYGGSTPGAFGYHGAYPSTGTNTVFRGSGAPGSVAIALQVGWAYPQNITGCHMTGFDHFFARQTSDIGAPVSAGYTLVESGNTSDLPATYAGGGTALSLPNWGNPYTGILLT